MPAGLQVSGLVVSYPGAARRALDAISFSVQNGRTLAVVGPSGAGKSTLLRVIAGLLRPTEGEIALGAVPVQRLTPQQRRIAVVFQDDALVPHLTVRKNLAFAARVRDDLDARIGEMARTLHLNGHLDRRPAQLSGGERQRAAIARALLSQPHALLLDEPLAHLDPELRARVRDEVIGLRERFAGPILYVTHDHAEAMSVGDEIAVLIDGTLLDSGEPQRVYDAPRNVRVAAFLGDRPMNIFDGVHFGEAPFLLGIRPERVRLEAGGSLQGTVTRREPTGADCYVHIESAIGTLCARVAADAAPHVRESIRFTCPPDALRRFDKASGAAR